MPMRYIFPGCCASSAIGAASRTKTKASRAVIMRPIIGEPADRGKCRRSDTGVPGLASLLGSLLG
jgi:hypothetical protein